MDGKLWEDVVVRIVRGNEVSYVCAASSVCKSVLRHCDGQLLSFNEIACAQQHHGIPCESARHGGTVMPGLSTGTKQHAKSIPDPVGPYLIPVAGRKAQGTTSPELELGLV